MIEQPPEVENQLRPYRSVHRKPLENWRRRFRCRAPFPWRNLAGLKRFTSADDPDLAAMEDLLGRLQRGHDGRTALYFALGWIRFSKVD